MISVSIVDDEKKLCESIATFVNGSPGFRCVSIYGSADAALKNLPKDQPDVVLMDINMAGMDGFEFCRALQQSADTRTIPILAVTGHSEYLDEPNRFRDAGISHVLIKPCEPAAIERELRRLITRPASLPRCS